jgi:hypothetical protein
MITDDEFRADPSTQSVLSQIPGFQLSMVRVDCMHCTKLGICHVVIGSSLVWLCGERAYKYLGPAVNEVLGPNASMQEQLDDLMLRFNEYVKGLQDSTGLRRSADQGTLRNKSGAPNSWATNSKWQDPCRWTIGVVFQQTLVLFCSRADSSPYDQDPKNTFGANRPQEVSKDLKCPVCARLV